MAVDDLRDDEPKQNHKRQRDQCHGKGQIQSGLNFRPPVG